MRLNVLLLGALLFPGGLPPANAQPVVHLVLPDSIGSVPQVLRLPLDVVDAAGVQSGTIDIVFDSTVVRPRHESLEQGAFALELDALWEANTRADTLRIVFATFAQEGYVGSGTWATVEWELVGAGTSSLHFARIELERDESGTPVVFPSTGEDGSVLAEPQAVEVSTWGRVKHRFGRGP
jgi:hypothetical protein